MEVLETDNPRHSFDLNLYQLPLSLAQISSSLHQAAQAYGIEHGEFTHHLQAIQQSALGHISGGIDRYGQDFLSIYYPTDIS